MDMTCWQFNGTCDATQELLSTQTRSWSKSMIVIRARSRDARASTPCESVCISRYIALKGVYVEGANEIVDVASREEQVAVFMVYGDPSAAT